MVVVHSNLLKTTWRESLQFFCLGNLIRTHTHSVHITIQQYFISTVIKNIPLPITYIYINIPSKIHIVNKKDKPKEKEHKKLNLIYIIYFTSPDFSALANNLCFHCFLYSLNFSSLSFWEFNQFHLTHDLTNLLIMLLWSNHLNTVYSICTGHSLLHSSTFIQHPFIHDLSHLVLPNIC